MRRCLLHLHQAMFRRASASGRSWAAVTRRQRTRRPALCHSIHLTTSTRTSPAARPLPRSTTTATSRQLCSATLAGDRSYRLAQSFNGNRAQIRSRPSCSATRVRSAHPLRSPQAQCNGPRASLRRRRPCPRLHSRVTLLSKCRPSHTLDRHTASSNRPTLEPPRRVTRAATRAAARTALRGRPLRVVPPFLQRSRQQGHQRPAPATSGSARAAFASCSPRHLLTTRPCRRRYRRCSPPSGSARAASE